jgi:hypothetical protein
LTDKRRPEKLTCFVRIDLFIEEKQRGRAESEARRGLSWECVYFDEQRLI